MWSCNVYLTVHLLVSMVMVVSMVMMHQTCTIKSWLAWMSILNSLLVFLLRPNMTSCWRSRDMRSTPITIPAPSPRSALTSSQPITLPLVQCTHTCTLSEEVITFNLQTLTSGHTKPRVTSGHTLVHLWSHPGHLWSHQAKGHLWSTKP